jgi:hypothetical protein
VRASGSDVRAGGVLCDLDELKLAPGNASRVGCIAGGPGKS